jgi:hypothetical protein
LKFGLVEKLLSVLLSLNKEGDHNGNKGVLVGRNIKKRHLLKSKERAFVSNQDYQAKKQNRKNRDLYIESLRDKVHE